MSKKKQFNKNQIIIGLVGIGVIIFLGGMLTGLKLTEKDVDRLNNKVEEQKSQLKTIQDNRTKE